MSISCLILPSLLKPLGTSLVNFLSLIHQPQSWKCYGHYSLPVFQQTIISGRAGMRERDWFSSQQKTWKTKTSSIIHLQPQKEFVASKAELSCCQDKVVCSSFSWMLYIQIYMTPTNNRSKKKVFTEVRATWFQLEYITYGKSKSDLLHTHIFSRACRKGRALTWSSL